MSDWVILAASIFVAFIAGVVAGMKIAIYVQDSYRAKP